MTEKIIKKENIEYKLICNLFTEWNRPAKYKFKKGCLSIALIVAIIFIALTVVILSTV